MGIYDYDYRFDRKNWFETFSAALGPMFARQVRFTSEITNGKDYSVDVENGTITFGGNQTFNIQILGKEDSSRNNWQWSFENFTNLNKDSLKLANNIKEFGRKFGNEALREPSFALNDIYNGHSLSIVACAVSEENYCYFKCDNPTGALFVAVEGLPDSIFEKVDVKQLMDMTLDRIEQIPVNQKIFIESFLSINQTPFVWETGSKLVADFGENVLIVNFVQGNGFLNISQMRITDAVREDDK